MCKDSSYYMEQMGVLLEYMKDIAEESEAALDMDKWGEQACPSAMLECFTFWGSIGGAITKQFKLLAITALTDSTPTERGQVLLMVAEYHAFWDGKIAELKGAAKNFKDDEGKDFDWGAVLGDQFN